VKYLQAKLKFALCVANLLINVVIIDGCIYETKQQSKEQLIEQKEQLKNDTNTIDKETDKEVDIQVVEPVNLGKFKLTAYCSCEECCGKWAYNRPNGVVYGAIGEELKEGYSIAVDPEVIPYRSEVVIDGKTYKAQDCGGAIKGNRIDVYFEDHDDALEFGVQYAEVFVNL
jgi:3D (Asp-Asp-Asp) domain-containing protein